ncbi:hypothetical protein ES703_68539 [subsurface metagenome]
MLARFFRKYEALILSEVEGNLAELGEEKVRELIENDISLWHVWQNKQDTISRLRPYYRVIKHIDVDELSHQALRLLTEHDSRFNFIPEQWLRDSLAHAHREILKGIC